VDSSFYKYVQQEVRRELGHRAWVAKKRRRQERYAQKADAQKADAAAEGDAKAEPQPALRLGQTPFSVLDPLLSMKQQVSKPDLAAQLADMEDAFARGEQTSVPAVGTAEAEPRKEPKGEDGKEGKAKGKGKGKDGKDGKGKKGEGKKGEGKGKWKKGEKGEGKDGKKGGWKDGKKGKDASGAFVPVAITDENTGARKRPRDEQTPSGAQMPQGQRRGLLAPVQRCLDRHGVEAVVRPVKETFRQVVAGMQKANRPRTDAWPEYVERNGLGGAAFAHCLLFKRTDGGQGATHAFVLVPFGRRTVPAELAKILGEDPAFCKIAEVQKLLSFPPFVALPFGHDAGFPVYMDAALTAGGPVVFDVGQCTLHVAPADLLTLTSATVVEGLAVETPAV